MKTRKILLVVEIEVEEPNGVAIWPGTSGAMVAIELNRCVWGSDGLCVEVKAAELKGENEVWTTEGKMENTVIGLITSKIIK
jgi:hypothetical protein